MVSSHYTDAEAGSAANAGVYVDWSEDTGVTWSTKQLNQYDGVIASTRYPGVWVSNKTSGRAWCWVNNSSNAGRLQQTDNYWSTFADDTYFNINASIGGLMSHRFSPVFIVPPTWEALGRMYSTIRGFAGNEHINYWNGTATIDTIVEDIGSIESFAVAGNDPQLAVAWETNPNTRS